MRTAPASAVAGEAAASRSAAGRSLRRLTLLLFVLFGAAYALFAQDLVSHNSFCRAVTAANLVQHGRIDIDGYEGFTTDLAVKDGVYYCDKAPGMSVLAAPVAWAFTQVAPITPETPYNQVWTAFLYLCSLATSGLITAAAATALFRYVHWRVGDLNAALVASLAFGLGSPVWGWATSFYSHSATAALLVLGFIALDVMARRLNDGSGKGWRGRPIVLGFLGGLALGVATAVEYTSIVPAAILGVAFLATSPWSRPWPVVQTFAAAGVGGLIALAPVMAYHAAAFGSPFTTGYTYAAVYDGTSDGLFGIGVPKLSVLIALLFSHDRGVFWYAPIVIATIWAAVRLARGSQARLAGIVVLLVAAWYLLMNAGFEYWHGGATSGPRYLTPAIGFSTLALGLAWPLLQGRVRRGFVALLGVAVLIAFACTAVDMTAGALVTSIAPSFLTGDLRHTLTYLAFDQPSLLHFAPPLIVGGVLVWLIRVELRRLFREEVA